MPVHPRSMPLCLKGINGQDAVTVKVITPEGTAVTELSATAAQPEIFENFATGYALALNQDQSANSAQNPAPAGSIVTIWATGDGMHSGGYPDGSIVKSGALSKPALPISVLHGNSLVEVLYAGDAPGDVFGVLQVNFRLPPQFGPNVTGIGIELQVGSSASNPVWIYVRP